MTQRRLRLILPTPISFYWLLETPLTMILFPVRPMTPFIVEFSTQPRATTVKKPSSSFSTPWATAKRLNARF